MERIEMIEQLEARLLNKIEKLAMVKGMLEVLIDIDRPVFINNKLKELQELIKD